MEEFRCRIDRYGREEYGEDKGACVPFSYPQTLSHIVYPELVEKTLGQFRTLSNTFECIESLC